jgi:hypothetical protein
MSKRRQIGLIERFTNKMTPLFRGLIGAGVDDPHAIAVELNRRGLRGLYGGRWKTRTVVAAIGRGAPELAGRVRRAQLRYPMANLELAWRAARQRANPFDLHILPAIRELLAAGVVHPHAIARELNRRGLCGPKGGKWKKKSVIRTVTRVAPELTKDLSAVGDRRRPGNADTARRHLELCRRAVQERANAYASQMLPVMRGLITLGFTPDLLAAELNRQGVRGRLGGRWGGSTVRRTVRRADPSLCEMWIARCADYVVRRDLRADNERRRKSAERLRRQAAAYRREIVSTMERLVAAGHDSTPKLAAELARLGMPTARGGQWRCATVWKLLLVGHPRLYRKVCGPSPNERNERFAEPLRPVIDGLVAQGLTLPRRLADELDRLEIPTQRGGPAWSPSSVRKLLRRFGRLGPPKRRSKLLTVGDLARQLGVRDNDIYAAVRDGQLVPIRVGRKLSFPPDIVERTLEARARAAGMTEDPERNLL